MICRDLPNVKFNLTMSWFDLPKVQGRKFLILHGEDVRRYMGFPWYSVNRMLNGYYKLVNLIGESFEYLTFGHHHVASDFQTSVGEWFCNGNWVGWTLYSVKRLYEIAPPKQWLLFVHKKQGITGRRLINLLVENKRLWRQIKKTEYDIHIPPTNQEILAAMERARTIRI